jgi:hypothetical protein
MSLCENSVGPLRSGPPCCVQSAALKGASTKAAPGEFSHRPFMALSFWNDVSAGALAWCSPNGRLKG